MGELPRKNVLRRLLALSEGEIPALMTALRQLGVGSQFGAEALAICHQLICDERASGSLNAQLARIKVDEKNCFGVIEWKAVRKAAAHFLPKHTAAAGRKHLNLSHVEKEGLSPMPKDRGAEQGDVDGPLKHEGVWLPYRRQATFLGLVMTTIQKRSAWKQNTRPSWVDPKNLPELTIHVMLCKKMEAWRISGTWMMVTSSVTRSWCRPECTNLMTPITKSVQSEIRRQQRSPAMWKT